MLQFAIETGCSDHTLLHAVYLFDTYVRNNLKIHPGFLRVVATVALQVSIKINDHATVTFQEIAESFDDVFSVEMLNQLE